MSVYIKGMEMSTNCSVCPMLEGDRMDGLCHAASRWLDDDEYWTWYVYPEGDMDDSKPCNCPLIPVREHGDLIDKSGVEVLSWTEDPEKDFADGVLFVLDKLDELPVIIPADGEEYEVPVEEVDE